MNAPITIIGSGLAGYNLARELRKTLPDAPIRMLTSDAGDFYSKPMLSNALAGNKSPAQLAMKPAKQMAEELKITVITGIKVTAIDPAAHTVVANEVTYGYSKLVLALGADPFMLGLAGDAVADVLTVNDLADYTHFRERLTDAKRVLLLGGGLIGCEFANDIASTGREVQIVDLADWPLSRLLPEAAGRYLKDKLAAARIVFNAGVSVVSVDACSSGYRVALSDGRVLEADLVLSAIGLKPRIQLAQAAGLQVNRGIVVGRCLETSDADIHALGDCAEVDGQVLPYVLPIMQGVRALAQTLVGTPTQVVYPAMPVVVKTPLCPTVVAPPAIGSKGNWQVEQTGDAVRARFLDETGHLLGFALLGSATAERQALAAQLPPVLA